MNPHDKTGNVEFPRADFLLARLFATMLFGVAMFAVGYLSGENRGYTEGRINCPVVYKKTTVTFKDMTNKQWARWQQFREDQAKGWIK